MASVIVDQLGDAIGQVALKNSKFNREHGSGDLYSARKLAKKLFNSLSDTYPRRDYLIVDGTSCFTSLFLGYHIDRHAVFSDFVPYFKTTSDAVSTSQLSLSDGGELIPHSSMPPSHCSTRMATAILPKRKCEKLSSVSTENERLWLRLSRFAYSHYALVDYPLNFCHQRLPQDVSSAVAKLDAVLFSVALLILIFVFLLIFNKSDTLSSLVPLATLILGFSFVFGNSAKTLFESVSRHFVSR